ncbi:MAG: prolipoprotein diacylglyceryl transferase [bacterium]|nr:prolipoprotein diacylglyceryl transferase [bacterium]
MIPYWHFAQIPLGPITIQMWGFFVALGILVALLVASRAVRKIGVQSSVVWDIGFWVVLAGFVGARLGHVFFYDWEFFQTHPSEILRVWHGGFSSFGGFAGAALAGILLLRRIPVHRWQFADAMILGVPLGWAIGRIGCFLIHDHPGTLTHFLLGVKYPDGVRHDLGLYDLINAALLAVALFLFRKPLQRYPGAALAMVAIWYGTVRFFLDFLRAYDTRYFGFTPAQYGSLIMAIMGIWMVIKIRRNPQPPTAV